VTLKVLDQGTQEEKPTVNDTFAYVTWRLYFYKCSKVSF